MTAYSRSTRNTEAKHSLVWTKLCSLAQWLKRINNVYLLHASKEVIRVHNGDVIVYIVNSLTDIKLFSRVYCPTSCANYNRTPFIRIREGQAVRVTGHTIEVHWFSLLPPMISCSYNKSPCWDNQIGAYTCSLFFLLIFQIVLLVWSYSGNNFTIVSRLRLDIFCNEDWCVFYWLLEIKFELHPRCCRCPC